ncbi:hypothetical protein G6F31_014180 [Rhizopus arrhizus]|nr:hypothetical protein G6F32_015027 [Rhizopus arrhizus]KAG0947504.1 hypothetical protein G6F31_014180 [Rhizopus arrhizus]
MRLDVQRFAAGHHVKCRRSGGGPFNDGCQHSDRLPGMKPRLPHRDRLTVTATGQQQAFAAAPVHGLARHLHNALRSSHPQERVARMRHPALARLGRALGRTALSCAEIVATGGGTHARQQAGDR